MLTEAEHRRLRAIRERQSERSTASGSDLAETDFLLSVIHKLDAAKSYEDDEVPLIVRRSDGQILVCGTPDPQAWLCEVRPCIYLMGIGDETLIEVDEMVARLKTD